MQLSKQTFILAMKILTLPPNEYFATKSEYFESLNKKSISERKTPSSCSLNALKQITSYLEIIFRFVAAIL